MEILEIHRNEYMISTDKNKLNIELKRKKGGRRGTAMANFYENPSKFIATMLVGNNIALVIFTILMGKLLEPYLIQFMDGGLLLFINTIIVTIVVLIFGEFLPKTLFRLFANNLMYFLTYPLLFFKFILAIPSWAMTKMSGMMMKYVFKTTAEEADPTFTRLDLQNFIEGSRSEDADEEIDKELFQKALELKNSKLRTTMIPRTEIACVDINDSVEDLSTVFQESHHSRLIVIDNDIDNVVGYVHHQQMLKNPKSIKNIMLDIPFVPESMRARVMMNKFIKERTNIGLVVDEYGGTAGIITLEDILEEIFGEIEDEHDYEEHIETVINDREFLFSGRLEIDYINEKYEQIDIPTGDYETLSGYIVNSEQNIPAKGATLEIDGYKFILELVSDTKIETIRLIKLETTDEKMD